MNNFFTLQNKRRPIVYYLVVGFALISINNLILSLCFYNHPEFFENPIKDKPIVFQLVFGVLLGSILETYLCQALIINFLDNLLSLTAKAQKYVVIGVPAVIFAALHAYSWAYQLAMLIPAFVFAYGYWFFRKEGKQAIAFWAVSGLHMLMNLVALCPDFF